MILRQYVTLLKYRILAISQYPLDIFFGICGTVLWHLPNFVLINVIFSKSEQMDIPMGYLILLYGLSVFGDGIQHTFAEALWQFGNTFIKTARFDGVLTKPMSNLIQILTSRFDVDGIGGILWGCICSFYGYYLLEKISLNGIFYMIVCMMCSACFFIGINALTASVAFIIYDNFYVTHAIFQAHMFARFPPNIYPKWLGIILTFIVPVFGATYYPAEAFLQNTWIYIVILLIISLCFIVFSVLIWNLFSKFYKSSGS